MPYGVSQLSFMFGDDPNDETQETKATSPCPSIQTEGAGSKPVRKKKWNSLIDKVYALPNLQRAWERVKANRGAAGRDGITIDTYAKHIGQWLPALEEDLRNKTYRPQPVRRVYIPKPGRGGEKRPLGIPSVRDRIVQQAIHQILSPIFEPIFSKRSHGFRPEKGCATALEVVDQALRYGYTWVVDADISAFFDTVDHERLLTALNQEVADGSLLKLIRRILEAGVYLAETSSVNPTEIGTPQGGPLSPLLANIYLHAFDMQMSAAGYGLVRYADDFVLFAKSREAAEAALSLARSILEGELGLRLHPEKTRVVSVTEGFVFLGFHYFRNAEKGIQYKEVGAKSKIRFRERIRSMTPRLHTQRPVKPRHVTLQRLSKNSRVKDIVYDLNLFLRGWHWYFKSAVRRYDPPFGSDDGFIRRRVRLAITGRGGNGWWNAVITNNLIRKLGLVLLTELQVKYQIGTLRAPVRKG